MDAYPDHGTIRLAQSYTDQAGLFSTAFTYDNALAILAHLAVPAGESRAVALGDALLYAQAHDPVYDDGRLRQAYNVGPYTFYDGSPQPDGFVKADGTANVGTQFGFTGTAVGDMAWAGIALGALAGRTGERRFLTGAVRIGEWIERVGRTDEPLGGYRFGVDGANRNCRSARPSTTPTWSACSAARPADRGQGLAGAPCAGRSLRREDVGAVGAASSTRAATTV